MSLPEDGPRKPQHHKPCNGCGLCCVATACAIAVEWIAGAAVGHPCPALEWENGRSWCGLVRHPFTHSPDLVGHPIVTAVVAEGVETPVAERILGRLIGDDLGGVGGRCDSGAPISAIFKSMDPDIGKTAAEFHREKRR